MKGLLQSLYDSASEPGERQSHSLLTTVALKALPYRELHLDL